MATKTSILIFYLKLSEMQKMFRWASLATLVVVNVGGAALTVLNIVQCRPISASFKDPSLREALKPLVHRYIPRILRDDPVEPSGLGAKMKSDFAGLQKAPPEGLPTSPDMSQQASQSTDNDRGCERVTMTMSDFITTPEMKELPARENPPARARGTKAVSRGHSASHGGFMNLEGPRSMVKMTNRESLPPLAQVSLLFFLWGFAYGLLDVLNSQFQSIVHMSFGQTMGLHSAYFGAYLVAPLTFGRIVLKKWGFKVTFITGLCIYACGTLIFWPSAVLESLPAFLVSNFIVGLGLSTLEIAANPFIALCGPPEYSELRINVAQGIQAVGSVVSPILARRVLFKQILNASSLVDVQWTYLGIALFDILLAIAFYYLPLPEASDADLEEVAKGRGAVNSQRIGKVQVIFLTLGLGAFSQWCYVGGQEAVSMAFSFVVKEFKPGTSSLKASDYQAIGHAIFAVGRFSAAFICLVLRPRKVLLVFYLGCVVTSVFAMKLAGDAGVALLILVYFFESAIWPTIFAISLRGLGSHTKTGACLLTVGASGGAVFPLFLGPIVQRRPQYSLCVAVAAYSFALVFPIYLNIVPQAKRQVDPVVFSESPSTLSSRSSRHFGVIRRIRHSAEVPVAEHVEEAPWQ
ncbi:MAG: hypothetical protein M1839_008716 [Geoglossum umbratile]|nr:MAG: hypothetical protein M1839_008716 [Geoglossum umbratile]